MATGDNSIERTIPVLFAVTAAVVLLWGATEIKRADAMCFPQPIQSMRTAAAGSNSLYMLWESDTYSTDSTGSHEGNHSLYFKKSSDSGKTFSDTIVLYRSGSVCSLYPHMAIGRSADGRTGHDSIYIMWNDGDKVAFRASNDSGSTFGDKVILGQGTLGVIGVPSPLIDGGQIATDGTNGVYVVWNFELDNNRSDILFRKSTDGGRSFSDPINLSVSNNDTSVSSSDRESLNPVISVSSHNNIYVSWSYDPWCSLRLYSEGIGGNAGKASCETKIQFARSTDGGVTFSNPVTLAHGSYPTNGISPIDPHIASAGANVYVTWIVGRNSPSDEQAFTRSNDNGGTFSEPLDVIKENSADSNLRMSSFPSMTAFDKDTIYVAWAMFDSDNGTDNLNLIKSTDGGRHFTKITSAIPTGFLLVDRISHQLAITKNGTLYFAWPQRSGEKQTTTAIFFEAVQENETSVLHSVPYQIYSTSTNAQNYTESFESLVAADDNHDNGSVYVVWTNSSSPVAESSVLSTLQILLRPSTDGGNTFGPTTMIQDVVASGLVPEFASAAVLTIAALITGAIIAASRLRSKLDATKVTPKGQKFEAVFKKKYLQLIEFFGGS